ncbi:MAG TPA: YqeG family HAD IIIA-type phosphatase [Lachnospiraceae bacterium]|nr:YqeG family HAD IIIA-type phosphatase [Lachnospiraceae bacterium]HPF30144.1 YqeG family HAD IIIA-type phosphatase [Lachnospiraceae bacterium]
MFQAFYPGEYIDSTYHIDFQELYRKGYRGIIFDIDNTLVPHGALADEQSIALFQQLRQLGFHTILLSNNKEPRVQPFAHAVKSRYIVKAGKPAVRNYRRAMKLMKTNYETTLFIGDQLFTDIWGANRTGIMSILVQPIHQKEEIQIVLKRYLERIVLHFYKKECRKKQSYSGKDGNNGNKQD